MNESSKLFARASCVIPGGVNSPVRAFGGVGGSPLFINRAADQYLWDEDGERYTDYISSWGPMILGHARPEIIEAIRAAALNGTSFGLPTRLEVEMAELVCSLVPSVEMLRMVSSGTEAVLSSLRLARGYTGRSMIVKFEGCYHGHADSMLVKAGSGLATAGIPDSAGVLPAVAAATLTCAYNDLKGLAEIFKKHGADIAAVIVEPVGANMGVAQPRESFLKGLRAITEKHGALLIFDEVITGFRLGVSCASGYFDITPDISTFGKIIGGGLPAGAYGGRKEIMSMVAPLGPVYQAGTLSGNPLAMAAGLTALKILDNNREIYDYLENLGGELVSGLNSIFAQYGVAALAQGVGSLATVFFADAQVFDYSGAKACDTDRYARWFSGLLSRGILVAPSQFEAMFISAAHTEADIKYLLGAAREIVTGKDF